MKKVKAKLQSEGAPIEISAHFGAASSGADDLKPKDDVSVELHDIFVDSDAARDRIVEIINEFPAFTEGDVNTLGTAHTTTQIVDLQELGKDAETVEWKLDGHTNFGAATLAWVEDGTKSRSSRRVGRCGT